METIKNAKIGSMESSAKLIAKSIETNYQVSLANGEDGTLSLTGSCLDSKFVDIDLNEYESCTYTITDGKAKVTLKGKDSGKFSGLICTDATKVSATCSSTTEEISSNEPSNSLKNTIISLVGNNTDVTSGTGGLKKYFYDSENTEISDESSATKIDYRYYGASPLNYVKFDGDDELWRIIGIVDGKVKLLRYNPFLKDESKDLQEIVENDFFDSIMFVSWDSSASSVNSGWGVNEWSTSDVKSLLNDYYYGDSNECLYCNGDGQGTCNNSCNSFISKMSSNVKNMIDSNATWYTASSVNGSETELTDVNASYVYKNEHGNISGKICTSADNSDYCNDTVSRTTTWNGAVGLISASDYGYASDLSVCTDKLEDYDNEFCRDTNWMYNLIGNIWTITPYASNAGATCLNFVEGAGWLYGYFQTSVGLLIYPSIFLKSNVYVNSGTGSKTDPYILKI